MDSSIVNTIFHVKTLWSMATYNELYKKKPPAKSNITAAEMYLFSKIVSNLYECCLANTPKTKYIK